MMRYFSEYSYEKIGGVLNKPVNTVGTLINRAKKKLLEVVNENAQENGITDRF
jgi:DNA-directed RNA polymerase specialized sigma24 family protein